MALTYPGRSFVLGTSSGISGVLDDSNRWNVLVPLATLFVSGLVNLVVMYPAAQNIMAQRRAQGCTTLLVLVSPLS
jgi:hypothetical protein